VPRSPAHIVTRSVSGGDAGGRKDAKEEVGRALRDRQMID
jgi:hypothetical protein